MQSLLIKDSLPHLAHLAIHRFCEILDSQSQLTNMRELKLSYDCCNKSYHGEWFDHITHLAVKCPNNVPLGVLGYYPPGLESLQLHTLSTDPVTISTGNLKGQPEAYPHQVIHLPEKLWHAASRCSCHQNACNEFAVLSVLTCVTFLFCYTPNSSSDMCKHEEATWSECALVPL